MTVLCSIKIMSDRHGKRISRGKRMVIIALRRSICGSYKVVSHLKVCRKIVEAKTLERLQNSVILKKFSDVFESL